MHAILTCVHQRHIGHCFCASLCVLAPASPGGIFVTQCPDGLLSERESPSVGPVGVLGLLCVTGT